MERQNGNSKLNKVVNTAACAAMAVGVLTLIRGYTGPDVNSFPKDHTPTNQAQPAPASPVPTSQGTNSVVNPQQDSLPAPSPVRAINPENVA